MSINGHSTGAMEQPPFALTGNSRDFLGSPAHDRGAFLLYTTWLLTAHAFTPYELWEITGPTTPNTFGYLKSTTTNPRPMVAGIYGMVINRQNVSAIADATFSVWLYGSNGQRIRVTADDFGAGYTTLPSGILQQQSNSIPDGNGGFIMNHVFWVLPDNGMTSTTVGGVPMWYYVFDSRILFGNSTTFWPQVIRPVFGQWKTTIAGAPFLESISATAFNFFSLNVAFDSNRNAWVSLQNDVYPGLINVVSPGFPPQFLETAGFLNSGVK